MTFIPESGWGWAYIIALSALGVHSLAGRKFQWGIWAVILGNWIAARSIDAFAPDNFSVWVASDIATIMAFAALRNRPSLVCAALYVAPLNFDLWTLLMGGSFDGAASVAEAIGYFCMIIGWGTSFDEDQYSILNPIRGFGRIHSGFSFSPRFPAFTTGKVLSTDMGKRNQENL